METSEPIHNIQKAKSEMEKSRINVTTCENEITNIKAALRRLGGAFDEEKELNTVCISAIKVNFENNKQKSIKIEITDPKQSDIITVKNNKYSEDNGSARFRGVNVNKTSVKFLMIEDGRALYTSKLYNMKHLCEINVMNDVRKKVEELDVIFEPQDTNIKSSNDSFKVDTKRGFDHKLDVNEVDETGKSICERKFINDQSLNINAKFKIEYYPSQKDISDILFDMLNDVSSRKAIAIDELRKSASLYNKLDKKDFNEEKVIQPGFLKKNRKKETSVLRNIFYSCLCLYNHTISNKSLLRSVLIPSIKNYVVFFGSVWWLHYYGQYLVLPPPV